MELFETINSVYHLIINNVGYLANCMLLTLQITITAIIIGIIWGTALAIMRLSNTKIAVIFATFYVNTFRSIPLVMVLLWFYLLVPQLLQKYFNIASTTDIRLLSAMTAFALFESAYYSEIIRAGFKNVTKGQYSAALALGMTSWQALRLIIMPQAFKTMTPLLLTQGIILFQDVTLVYAIGLTDFFRACYLLGEGSSSSDWQAMLFFAGFVYFCLCFTASLLVNFLKKRTAS